MLVWVIYDISENKRRSAVSRICKGYGLYRVQKSAFLGALNSNELESLSLECEEHIDLGTDSVYVFPLCDDCFNKIKLLGESFDKKLISNKIVTKFF